MHTETAKSWTHLQELLFENSWNAELGRYRSSWTFRGLSDANYELVTSLMRLGGDYVRLERHLLRNFMKYAHRDVVERDFFWHWLSVAQHHGLPTRLLDWTYSPLVATHFATANTLKFDHDGVIWCINIEKAQKLLPKKLTAVLEDEGAIAFTTELLNKAVKTLGEFDALSRQPFLLFFEPPSMDDRIVNQFALFSLMSNPSLGLEDWIKRHPDLCQRIIIPKDVKWEIRDKLDQCNITERVLFPGLDGLSRWLCRHYSPKER